MQDPETDVHIFEAFFDDEVSYYADSKTVSMHNKAELGTGLLKTTKVFQATKSRVTSLATDIPICIGILLGLDVESIAVAPLQDRVRTFWREMKEIPAGLLSYPCERLPDPDLLWAPASLDGVGNLGPPGMHPCHQISRGLSVSLQGLTVVLPETCRPQGMIAVRVQDRVFYIRQNLRNDSEPWASLDFSRNAQIGIIFGRTPPDEGYSLELDSCLAAMVAVVGREGDVRIVHYLRAVTFVLAGSSYDEHPLVPWTSVENREKALVLNAELTSETQEWLLTPV